MGKPEISEEEKKEVYEKVGKFQEEILAQWRKPFQNPNPQPVKIVYCMTFYRERIPQVAKCLKRVSPHVDRCLLVHDDTVNPSDIIKLYKLSDKKAQFIYRKWDDHFSKQRNAYLDHINEGEWVCYDDQTEILTDAGFKYFSELDGSELVLTMNPETFMLEYQKPTKYVALPYIGKVFHWRGDCYDVCVTPNHRMFVRTSDSSQPYRFLRAKELAKYSRFWIQTAGDWVGQENLILECGIKNGNQLLMHECVPNNTFVKLLGWYLADGWTHPQQFRHKVEFSDPDEESQKELHEIATKLNRNLIVGKGNHSDTVTLYYAPFFRYVKPLGKSWEKYVPKEVKNLPKKELSILLETYLKGDGHDQRTFTTTSKRLADDIQEICIKLGLRCTLHKSDRTGVKGGINSKGKQIIARRPVYIGSISKFRHTYVRNRPRHKTCMAEDYAGYVYCVTVPNHLICVRRNGKVSFLGNCVSDPDELFSVSFLKDMRAILTDAEKQGINILGINAHDLTQYPKTKVRRCENCGYEETEGCLR
jgi:hypothetical protein